jgi:anti-anti-sigma factor
MKISTFTAENEVVFVAIEGEIDAHTARKLDETLEGLLAQGHKRLMLDVSQMSFISSAGLRAIMFAQREAGERGGEVRVCGPDSQTRRIFEMVGLDECLKLSETCQEAIQGW